MKKWLFCIFIGVAVSLSGNPVKPLVFALQNGKMAGEAAPIGNWTFVDNACESSGKGWETLCPKEYSARKELAFDATFEFDPVANGAAGVQIGWIYSGDNRGWAVLYYPAEKEIKVCYLEYQGGKLNNKVHWSAKADLGDKVHIKLTPTDKPYIYRISANGKTLRDYFFGISTFFHSGVTTIGMKAKFTGFRITASAPSYPVVAFGDSITHHCRWQDEVTRLSGIPIYNAGLAGEGSTTSVKRFEADVVTLKPRLVIIFIGTNNSKPASALSDIDKMVQMARKHNIEPMICELLPRHDKRDVQSFNQSLKAYAKEFNIPVVDWYQVFADENGKMAEKYGGHVHPNKKGVQAMAEYFLSQPQLVKVLKGEEK